jgi:hypothetical protein
VSAVEAIMLEKFRTEPFHNLHLLYGKQIPSPSFGGSCSDKTLSFLATADQAGFDVALHSGFIGGREIHRLARVCIDDQIFFADVGNGWPALKLYPADREIQFRCFGMGFRTEIAERRVSVFHKKNGKESLQLEIDICSKPESEIRADIKGRFRSGVEYPFSNSLRFSLIVGDRFLFLREDRLEIYSNCGFQSLNGLKAPQVPAVILHYFGCDVRSLFPTSFGLEEKESR